MADWWWGRRWMAWALVAAAAFAATSSCSSSDPPPEPCPAELEETNACFVSAALRFAELAAERRLELAAACASIAVDLGASPPEVNAETSAAEVEEVCDMAWAAVQAMLDQGATLSMDVTHGECTPDESAQAACEDAFPDNRTCRDVCEAETCFSASCTPTVVAVTSSDQALAATLEDNVPSLCHTSAAQAECVVAFGGVLLDSSVKLPPEAARCAGTTEAANSIAQAMVDMELVLSTCLEWVSGIPR